MHCKQFDSSGPEQRAQGPKQAGRNGGRMRVGRQAPSSSCPAPHPLATYPNIPDGWSCALPQSSRGHTGHRPLPRSQLGSHSARCPLESLPLHTARSHRRAAPCPQGRLWADTKPSEIKNITLDVENMFPISINIFVKKSFFSFWLHPRYVEVPRPGFESMPQQRPKLQQ